MVTYNRLESLSNIFKAINEFGWKFDHFIIVDNNSSDGTFAFLSQFAKNPAFSILSLSDNIGHGAGLFMALQHLANLNLNPEYILLLEDDSIPSADLPDILLNTISSTDYGIISPAGSLVKLGRRIQVKVSPGQIEPADFCLFDGAMIRYEVIKKIGLPMRDWFMMVDDYEYCFRIKKYGFKIGVINNSFHDIKHLGGGGSFTRSTLWRGYYQSRNHVFFLKEHFTIFHLLDFTLLQGKRFLASFIPNDRFQRVGLRILGYWHGLIGRKGRALDPETLRYRH